MKGRDDEHDWAVKLAMGTMSAEDQARLDAWLGSDRRREAALLHAKVTLAFVERAQSVLPAEATVPKVTRRHAMAWSASALAAGAAGLYLLPAGDRLSTKIGEVRRARLADASIITLNTQSRVTVNLEPKERRISLDRGEAWFQVAHDKTRPFIVSAADLRIRAVGTAFSVRRMSDGVNVLVTDGVVEVWRADQPGQRARVSRDHRVFVPDDSVAIAPVAAKDAVERALAWRAGRLALAGETLDYAVEELNRYNRAQIRIDDPVLARAPIYGYFRVDDPQGFAEMIAASEDARIEADRDTLRIIPKIS